MNLAFYDLEDGPVSYDFVNWLVRARMEVSGPMHVVIVPHEGGLGGFCRHWGEHDEAAARWRLWHIVMPAAQLIGATICYAASRDMAEDLLNLFGGWWPTRRGERKTHTVGPIVDASRAGAKIPKLRATDQARKAALQWVRSKRRPVVTLTLRHQNTEPERNSDRAAWNAFAEYLSDNGFEPWFLEDGADALAHCRGLPELDIDLRLALYETAHFNVVGHNGPAALLFYSEAPFMQMGVGVPEHPWLRHYRSACRLEKGDNLPWFRPDQALVWEPDTFDNLVSAFEEWRG